MSAADAVVFVLEPFFFSLFRVMLFQDLAAALKGTLSPLWLITGEEPLLMLEAADMIRQQARAQGCTEREVLNASALWDWSKLIDACQAMSLFGDKKIVELRLASPRPGVKGADMLGRIAQMPLDGVVLIISVAWDWQLKSAAWYKKLAAAAQVVECAPVPARELPAWFKGRLAQKGLSAEPEALRILAERCEGNLLAANQEVLKLYYRFGQGKTIEANDVSESVLDVSRFDVENLLEAIVSGDGAKAVRVLENLRAKAESIPAFLWAIAEDLRAAARVRSLMDAGISKNAALMQARIFPESRKRRAGLAASRMTSRRLASALMLAADIDKISKGLVVADRDADPWIELASLASFLAR